MFLRKILHFTFLYRLTSLTQEFTRVRLRTSTAQLKLQSKYLSSVSTTFAIPHLFHVNCEKLETEQKMSLNTDALYFFDYFCQTFRLISSQPFSSYKQTNQDHQRASDLQRSQRTLLLSNGRNPTIPEAVTSLVIIWKGEKLVVNGKRYFNSKCHQFKYFSSACWLF